MWELAWHDPIDLVGPKTPLLIGRIKLRTKKDEIDRKKTCQPNFLPSPSLKQNSVGVVSHDLVNLAGSKTTRLSGKISLRIKLRKEREMKLTERTSRPSFLPTRV